MLLTNFNTVKITVSFSWASAAQDELEETVYGEVSWDYMLKIVCVGWRWGMGVG